jgi:multiple RNA-binding domain-containing protein 1
VQIADKELPKSRRQQRLEKLVPQNDEYIAPLQKNALKRKRDQDEQEQDPKLKEFLQVYQPPSKTNAWTNGDTQLDVPIAAVDHPDEKLGAPEDDSDDDYQVIVKKPKPTIDNATSVSSVKPVTDKVATESIEETTAQHNPDMEGVEEAVVADHGPVSDADWLRSRTNRVLDLVADDDQPTPDLPTPKIPHKQDTVPEPAEQPPEAEQSVEQQLEVPSSSEVEKIRETGRLYLRNLHFDITEEELRDHFAKYGSLEEVRDLYSSLMLPATCAMMNIHDRDN